jgi:benzoyl-CoA reductase subunit B
MNEKALKNLNELLAGQKNAKNSVEMSSDRMNKLQLLLLEAKIQNTRKTIECIENKLPFISSWYAYAPEIYTAMDLHWYCLTVPATFGQLAKDDLLIDILEETDRLSLSKDICTLQRLCLNSVKNDTAPIPTASISATAACDGIALMHEAVMQHKSWKDVPVFYLDPPYWKNERSIDYYADEFKGMVSFLEEHTGKKLDIGRLSEVLQKSNKQYELWMEYNELRRSVPCPHPSFSGVGLWDAAQNNPTTVGRPEGTEYIIGMLSDAENQIRKKKGGVKNEKIRLLWYDIMPMWSIELTNWLGREWNANVVMDLYSYFPYSLIDTSNEKSIFRGIAKRYLYDTPMIRQTNGTVDTLIDDVIKIVKDFKIDCVVGPGHMGHKDQAASMGILREVCREIEVPFLFLEFDLYDPRYTIMDVVKDRLSEFFITMDLG